MREKMIKNNLVKRLLIYMAGVFIMAMGLALYLQSGLGFPVNSSVAYVLGQIISLKYSYSLIIVNVLLVIVQILILRRNFKPLQLLQIPAAVVLGYFVDLCCRITDAIVPGNYFASLGILVMGILLLSLSISLTVNARLVPMPLEGLALAVTQSIGKYPLHKVKRVLDVCIVAFTVAVSFTALGRLEGAREGTVLTALTVAPIMEFFTQRLKPMYRWAGCGYEEKTN